MHFAPRVQHHYHMPWTTRTTNKNHQVCFLEILFQRDSAGLFAGISFQESAELQSFVQNFRKVSDVILGQQETEYELNTQTKPGLFTKKVVEAADINWQQTGSGDSL